MAKKSGFNPWRDIISLVIIIGIIYALSGFGALTGSGGLTPKFALDLAGGTQIILTPKLDSGQNVDETALDQAISVIRQRVDASGVSEAEITKQGGQNIVVGIPGERPSDETVELISKSAKMNFRPVIMSWAPQDETNTQVNQKNYQSYIELLKQNAEQSQTEEDTSDTEALDGIIPIDNNLLRGYYAESRNSKTSYDLSASTSSSASSDNSSSSASLSEEEENALPILTDDMKSEDKGKDSNSAYSYVTQELDKKFKELNCIDEKNRKGGGEIQSTYDKAIVTCAKDNVTKYLLGPVTVQGKEISHASSGLKGTSGGGVTNEWVVNLQFTTTGDDQFIKSSDIIKKLDIPRNEFAITLDGLVISAPSIQPSVNFAKGNGVQISGGSGGFKQDDANLLANQLSFGSLPMNFDVQNTETVSASLGSEQLEKGLLAGLFGLILVVLYSFLQYQVLGLLTVGSLAVASFFTYGVIILLSWIQGYRLSLASIIGVIVAIGITADSFIVYFERLKDEIRDGRTLDIAIARGWKRAIRTIIASDAINFICAFVLYFLAVGGVRGFAFTLGLTTLIDLVIVVLFTHPVLFLLAQIPFFRFGHDFSGLSPKRLGASRFTDYAVAKHDFLEQKLKFAELEAKYKQVDEDDQEVDDQIQDDDGWGEVADDKPAKKDKKKDKKSKKEKEVLDDDGWGEEEENPKKDPKKEKKDKKEKVKKEKPSKVEDDDDFDGWGE